MTAETVTIKLKDEVTPVLERVLARFDKIEQLLIENREEMDRVITSGLQADGADITFS